MMLHSPCPECPDKGCGAKHDTCEKYQAYVTRSKELNNKAKHEAYLRTHNDMFNPRRKGGTNER